MMNRKLLILVIIYGFVFGGLVGLKGEILILAFPFVIYLAVGLFESSGEPELQVERVIEPERALPGIVVNIKVSIKNTGLRPCIVALQDHAHERLEVISGNSRLLAFLAPGQTTELNYDVEGSRGIYLFDYLKVTNLGNDGISESEKCFPTQGQMFVLPHIPQLKRVSIRTRQTKVYSGNIPSRVSGFGTDFYGVREYQPGDPLRYVNWRISARYPDSLYCNEFERERVTDTWLILDGRQRSNLRSGDSELFEHIVLSGAGLAQALIKEGNRVGLLVYGGYLRWTFPGYGKIQREKMLRALAQAKPGDLFIFSDFENLPTRAFPISSQIILISPLHSEDIPVLLKLKARGYAILIISPDPVLFENSILSLEDGGNSGLRIANVERQLNLKKLQNAGIRVINWDVSIPFERAVQAPLRNALRIPQPVRQNR